ncbi:sugar phosphate isomerase/epimerase family protein [Halovulum sp. GXIMD14794]
MGSQMIASYFTLAGDAVPFAEPAKEASPEDLSARAMAAAEAGYWGMGLSYPDLLSLREKVSVREMRDVLDAAGLPLLELECIVDWHAAGARREASDEVRRTLLDIASEIGACHIKVAGDQFARDCPWDVLVASFRGLCDDAAAVGTRIVIECMPWSNVHDIHIASRLVAEAGASNGGVLMDIWHVARAGTDFADIAGIPPETIGYIELCDALTEAEPDLKFDTINNRRLCGEGQLDVAGFVKAVKATGYDGLWGVEVISHEQRRRTPAAAAALSLISAREFL